MPTLPAKKCCGFTLLEFAVAAGLLGLLVAALLSRLLFYQEQAERVAAEQLVGTLRTALQVRAAQVGAAGGEGALQALAEQNPISWLSGKPQNYLGEYYSPDLEELPRGNWFFDRTDKSLVYLHNGHKSFSFETSTFLKFKVKLLRLPNPTGLNGRTKVTKGLVLDQVSDRAAVKTN
jgi:type II secretory pathway pseudopilin PulG